MRSTSLYNSNGSGPKSPVPPSPPVTLVPASVPIAGAGHVTAPVGALGAMCASVLAAAVLVGVAWRSGAGSTADVSLAALLGWLSGSVASLLAFAWFRSVDASRRSDASYVEPDWRPGWFAIALAAIGLLIGSVGAVFVAEALART